jgi:hypothetical protein
VSKSRNRAKEKKEDQQSSKESQNGQPIDERATSEKATTIRVKLWSQSRGWVAACAVPDKDDHYLVTIDSDQTERRLHVNYLLKPDGTRLPEWWPRLQLKRLPDALPFPVDVFTDALARYCGELASAMCASVDFVGAAMLATASAAIGQSVNIRVKAGWVESPLLFLVLVGHPGKLKTPVVRAVVSPLVEIDRMLRDQSTQEWTEWKTARESWDGSDPGPEPPRRRVIIKDVTREALALLLADNPRGLLSNPDELSGWVASFNEYKKKGSDRQFWLSVWSCDDIIVDRKAGRECIHVRRPFVSVVGCIPPAMLGALEEEQGRKDGLLDRLLFSFPAVFPPQNWTDETVSEDAEREWARVVEALHSTAMENVEPNITEFSDQAKDTWVNWFNMHSSEIDNVGERQAGAWSKLRGHCARFALILSRLRIACEAPPVDPDASALESLQSRPALALSVERQDVEGAIKLVDYFKSHLFRIEHQMTGGLGNPDARQILDWVRRKRLTKFRAAEISTDLRQFYANPEGLSKALTYLVENRAIRPGSESGEPHKRGRKPTQLFEVHPELRGVPDNTNITTNSPSGAN